MSQENVEIAKAFYEAWNAGNMDAVREAYDLDVIVRTDEAWPERGPYVGRDAVMRWLVQLRETWDTDVLEATSITDAGDRVLVRQIWRTVGHGPEANLEVTSVSTYRKGKVILVEFFWDHAEALEVVGLSEQVMSQENVELTHRAWDAFNRRDLDAYLALMDDDVEAVPRAVAMEGGHHYHGHDGVRRWWKDLLDVFPDFAIEGVEARDLGDAVVAAVRIRGHGRGSDTPAEEAIWNVIRWRRGKCVWWRTFDTQAEALEAAEMFE